jgi:hypothetical protein
MVVGKQEILPALVRVKKRADQPAMTCLLFLTVQRRMIHTKNFTHQQIVEIRTRFSSLLFLLQILTIAPLFKKATA